MKESREHLNATTPITVVNAQPVGFHSGTYATPAPQGHHVSSSPSVRAELARGINNTATVPRPLPGRWRDSICDWPQNMFPSCFCVCFLSYGIWLLAQMSQKTGFATFSGVIAATVAVWVITAIVSILFIPVASLLIPLIFCFVFALLLRLHIVQRENINEIGLFGEFCCGFWCWYCSVTQMARHLYGYSKVLDGDSDPFRPDNYGPMAIV